MLDCKTDLGITLRPLFRPFPYLYSKMANDACHFSVARDTGHATDNSCTLVREATRLI